MKIYYDMLPMVLSIKKLFQLVLRSKIFPLILREELGLL